MSEAERLALAALKIGVDMRAAQTEYFTTRHGDPIKVAALTKSRRLEREFDKAAAAALKAKEGLAL
jgi:hypothetical protein